VPLNHKSRGIGGGFAQKNFPKIKITRHFYHFCQKALSEKTQYEFTDKPMMKNSQLGHLNDDFSGLSCFLGILRSLFK